MMLYLLTPLLGVLAGWLLSRRVRFVPACAAAAATSDQVSVIIPARDEQENLPRLLASIGACSMQPAEVIVVDDHSTDSTAAIARTFAARVVASAPLPDGWTGKTWACVQGAAAARGDLLLFLDADTWLARDGFARLLALQERTPKPCALSVLPYHSTRNVYEQLSLFFNLIMAAGAGGFSGHGEAALFGQSLLIPRMLYEAAGGHTAVRGHVLENLYLAPLVRAAGGATRTALGRGVLEMRMFPDGVRSLVAGWQKSFASGAVKTPTLTVALIAVWLAGASLAAMNLVMIVADRALRATLLVVTALGVELAMTAAIFLAARKLGNFRWWSALFYPFLLVFYLFVFAWSVWLHCRGRGATWKGRRV